MLQCFSRYLHAHNFRTFININYNYKTSKNKSPYFYKSTILISYSPFFKKAYFRSLITYINILYSNLNSPNVTNYFYYLNYIILNISDQHPGFLFKKYHIK